MPTTFPASTLPRRRPAGFRRALASAALQLAATWLLKAAHLCVNLVDKLER